MADYSDSFGMLGALGYTPQAREALRKGMLPIGGSQAQVRAIDNQQVDSWGRTPAGPDADYFGDSRSTMHAQGQQTIDHLNARALHAARLIKKGKSLKGTGYETAPQDWDAFFGLGTFKADFLNDRSDLSTPMHVGPGEVPDDAKTQNELNTLGTWDNKGNWTRY